MFCSGSSAQQNRERPGCLVVELRARVLCAQTSAQTYADAIVGFTGVCNARRDFLSCVIDTLLSIAWHDSSLLSQTTSQPTLHVDQIHSEALMTIVWVFVTNYEPVCSNYAPHCART